MNTKALLGAALIFTAPIAIAQQPDLTQTLAKLDAASAKFTNAQADVHNVSWNYLIKDVDDDQHGIVYFIREKSGSQMGMKTEGKEARTVEYKNNVARIYNPSLKCFDTVRKAGIDTYLTLGFGSSGKDLARAWDITDLGPETIDGIKTEKLDLIPKDAAVKANVTKFTLWLDLSRAVSVKQILLAPSKDTHTATYSKIRVNEKVDTKPFEFKGSPCSK
jgi:outer membrane lipoprotein-sorting protein